jgi:uncharacterized protein (TIGR02284 family)
VAELSKLVNQIGGETDGGHTISGTIHRNWLDLKATFSGHDRSSILAECERGEDAIKEAYQDALNSDNGLIDEVRQVVSTQSFEIIASHDQIKAMRQSTN